ncbi:DNA polymerase III subunit delta' [Rhodobacteraceae bacterium DSL-40]|uniref:DNA polymerase III subunit delta' n=1 Tax=Amaricoccus sp. B4 TaxID=3368557 RepID=UPI000DAB7BF1
MSETETRPEPDRRPGAPHPRETVSLHGQAPAEAAFLEAAHGGRMHHAWLVTGPAGIGKATLAWRIARYMLAGGTGASLEMDPATRVFRQAARLSAPGLVLCRRPWDEKAKRLRAEITVEEARGLKSAFQMSAPDGAWRVAIIDAVDEMNVAAANALLKILEEPPAEAMLLLVCHRPSRVLPTIRSRCRELRCRPLGAEDLGRALAGAGHPVSETEARVLTALSGGSAGEALDLAAGGGIALYNEAVALLAGGCPLDRRRMLALADACSGPDAAERFRLTLRLLELVLARLGRAGAGATPEPVSEAEAGLLAHLGRSQDQARIWAGRASEIRARAETARAVNLDPAQVILDTLLQIDAAAAEANRLAA